MYSFPCTLQDFYEEVLLSCLNRIIMFLSNQIQLKLDLLLGVKLQLLILLFPKALM